MNKLFFITLLCSILLTTECNGPEKIRIIGADPNINDGSPSDPSDDHVSEDLSGEHENVLTQENFVYLGAFRMPDTKIDGHQFGSRGQQLAYRADGDSAGPNDGFPGSLFTVAQENLVTEISIPKPVVSATKDPADLPIARLVHPGFVDITEGCRESLDLGNGANMGGLFYMDAQLGQDDPKLYWSAYRYYNVASEDLAGFGWSSADLDSPEAQCLWHLGPFNSEDNVFHVNKTAGYIFDAPQNWADQFLEGKPLIAGLALAPGQHSGSAGPPMFAFAPWEYDNGLPPPPNAELEAMPMLWYRFQEGKMLNDHTNADVWRAGAWLTAGDKHCVLIVGRKGLGEPYYGIPEKDRCSPYKGWHADPYESQFLCYDPEDLIDILNGEIQPWGVQPYLRWSPSELFPAYGQPYPTCQGAINGAVYDRDRQFLYILQPNVDWSRNPYAAFAVVHVWRIAE